MRASTTMSGADMILEAARIAELLKEADEEYVRFYAANSSRR